MINTTITTGMLLLPPAVGTDSADAIGGMEMAGGLSAGLAAELPPPEDTPWQAPHPRWIIPALFAHRPAYPFGIGGGSGSITPKELLQQVVRDTPLDNPTKKLLEARGPGHPFTDISLQVVLMTLTKETFSLIDSSPPDLTSRILTLVNLVDRSVARGFLTLSLLALSGEIARHKLPQLLLTAYHLEKGSWLRQSATVEERHRHAVNLRKIILLAEALHPPKLLEDNRLEPVSDEIKRKLGLGDSVVEPEPDFTKRHANLRNGPDGKIGLMALLALGSPEGTWDVVVRGWKEVCVASGNPANINREPKRGKLTLFVSGAEAAARGIYFTLVSSNDCWGLSSTQGGAINVDGKNVWNGEWVPLRDGSRILFGGTEYLFRYVQKPKGSEPQEFPIGTGEGGACSQ